MQSRSLFRILVALLLMNLLNFSFAVPLQLKSSFVNASVPVVNKCNNLPKLFEQHWHFRNTFDVIIKKGTVVNLELMNPESIGDGEFLIICEQNTDEEEQQWTFSKAAEFLYEGITIDITCVPTVGVLKLCQDESVEPIVKLSRWQKNRKPFLPLPMIEFKSFDTFDFISRSTDVKQFLGKIDYYGFVSTPKAQILIGPNDVDELLENNRFLDGLKVINDVIEKYTEYSGRSSISITNGPRVNVNLEKHGLFLKSKKCGSSDCENIDGYYNEKEIVLQGDQIVRFFTPDAKEWTLLLEIGHHFDLFTKDLYIDVTEAWANIYAAFYQSRFSYKNESDYWMMSEDFGDYSGNYKPRFWCEDRLDLSMILEGWDDYSGSQSQIQYDSALPLLNFKAEQRVHFLMALFTVDNHDSSIFRSYNIRTMNDSDTTNNILGSIAVFIKDRYNVNVAPFVERVIYKGIPWLNLTNIYDLADSQNFRMPCFYYLNATDYPRYKYEEHNLKVASNLRLCSTTMKRPRIMRITINNTNLIEKRIIVNSVYKNVTQNPIEIGTSESVFMIRGSVNKTAVILPTYTFCSFNKLYRCTATPEILTYDDLNPSQLLPPFRFDIFGMDDKLIAVVQIDVRNLKMLIKIVVEDGHRNFPISKGPYIEVKLFDDLRSEKATYGSYGREITVGDTWVDIGLNYTFELNTCEKHRVKIFNYTLNDLETNVFKIHEFGVSEVTDGKSKILTRFVNLLSEDLEYKPYLKYYQHLVDLLRIMKNAIDG